MVSKEVNIVAILAFQKIVIIIIYEASGHLRRKRKRRMRLRVRMRMITITTC